MIGFSFAFWIILVLHASLAFSEVTRLTRVSVE